tara:strand:+ start:679 stop:1473 length:795 start_codon:yes stop_codon:yes gene_type:complete
MKIKEKIKLSFDKGSIKYDNFSSIQNMVGDLMINILKETYPNLKSKISFKKVLELGSGTGEFSKKVLDLFDIKLFHLIDISPEMIKKSKSKLPSKNIKFSINDFDYYQNFESQNFILSNMSLHWSSDIIKLIKKILSKLGKNSIFFFSVPDHSSFKVINNIFFKNEKNKVLNGLPEKKKILNIFDEKNFDTKFKTFNLQKKYKDPLSFLKELKQIGANTKISDVSLKNKKKINQSIFFLRKFVNKKIVVNYSVSCFLIRRKDVN